MRFSIGTTNPNKVRELAAILRPLEIPLEVTDPIDPEETGETFEENAAIKARAYGQHVGQQLAVAFVRAGATDADVRTFLRMSRMWTISEDSGLVIPALGGLPGPWSARFVECEIVDHRVVRHIPTGSPREAIDVLNNEAVLGLLEGIEQPRRAAKFVVALMVADTEGEILFHAKGEAHGWIVEDPRGNNGFGYDPIFASDRSFGKTWAEIDPMRKNLISHRRRALQEFTAWLGTQLRKLEDE